ncbi:MAG: N-methyl-L-tryptophan oxidase [Microbacterium sp.]|uniref:N-methyl-L-tryptophan oxidase n=1 Tax=Microbacterium sp. TaxID=51671 RepID=UPI0039E4D454
MSDEAVDVVVVGLGSIGSMALWHLARSGQSVLGIEQFGRVHAAGAYPGESRLFRVAAKEGALYTPTLLRSRELWQELGEAAGRDILIPAGALHIAPGDHEDLAATLKSAEDYNLPHEVLDAAELRKRYPQFHIEDDDRGVLDTLGGAMRPETAVLAAQEQALRHGARILADTEVTAIEPSGDGVVVRAGGAEVRARRAVVAAGPWTTRLVPELGDVLAVASFTLTWLMPRHPELFTPDRFPGFMRDLDGEHAFGVPTLDGFSIKMSPHVILPDVDDVADRITDLTPEQLRWVGEIATRMIPDLVPEPVRWSIHPDSLSNDKAPVIDTIADGRIVVAAGMSGNGFKFIPVYGLALAELATHGASPWQHERFTIASHCAA